MVGLRVSGTSKSLERRRARGFRLTQPRLFFFRKITSCCVKRPFERYTSGYRPASFDKILSHIPHISEGVFVGNDLEKEVNSCSF